MYVLLLNIAGDGLGELNWEQIGNVKIEALLAFCTLLLKLPVLYSLTWRFFSSSSGVIASVGLHL